jgi:hypothetical protein
MLFLKTIIKRRVNRVEVRNWILVVMLFLLASQSSCKKFIQVPPPAGTITENSVYTSDATAISVLTALYGTMNSSPIQGAGSISMFAALSADEYTLNGGITSTSYLAYYRNELSQINPTDAAGGEHWPVLYNFIFRCNAAIEGLNNSSNLTPIIKQQLLGEAKFLRAFFYFYLVNEFGDVALALTTDPQINTVMPRSPQSDVYDQIISDLQDAENLLTDSYLDATLLNTTTERTRPTRWAAAALLARVYLYTRNYIKAEEHASVIINNTTLFGPLPTLNNAFLKNSQEAIWQLQPTAINFNTVEAQTLIIPQTGPSTGAAAVNPVYLSKQLLLSFEVNDKRAVYGNWIDTTIYKLSLTKNDTVAYPNKYKLNTNDPTISVTTGTKNMKEYFMVLRLGEQYLIRAEARAQLGNVSGAQDDLNTIRIRAGLPLTTAGDKNSLLVAIMNERQVELFSEWGHRWFDLKRTGKVDEVMKVVTPLKASGFSWQSYQKLYPIPLSELQTAPNILQNDGYN